MSSIDKNDETFSVHPELLPEVKQVGESKPDISAMLQRLENDGNNVLAIIRKEGSKEHLTRLWEILETLLDDAVSYKK